MNAPKQGELKWVDYTDWRNMSSLPRERCVRQLEGGNITRWQDEGNIKNVISHRKLVLVPVQKIVKTHMRQINAQYIV